LKYSLKNIYSLQCIELAFIKKVHVYIYDIICSLHPLSKYIHRLPYPNLTGEKTRLFRIREDVNFIKYRVSITL